MAYRFVRARPRWDRLAELRERLDRGEIEEMNPFGGAMTRALEDARFDAEAGEAVWIEEDYCSPPLAMERREVLDHYIESITVFEEDVDEAGGGGGSGSMICPGFGNRNFQKQHSHC